MKFDVHNVREMVDVANYIKIKYLNESVHIFINGIVGAGKSTLASLLVNNFQYAVLTSSSYSLVNIYDGCPLIVHCDFYRSQWSIDFFDLEINPLINGYHILICEWVAPQILDDSITALSVKIDVCSFGTRTIEVSLVN